MGFSAQARVGLSEPETIVARVCEHLIEHDAKVEELSGGKIVRFAESAALLSYEGTATLIDISAPSLEGLYFMRMAIASHILEFAGNEPPLIKWEGDGCDLAHPPNFRILEVAGLRHVTPHMRRITLSGEDVARFAPLDALHVNVLIQRPELEEPQWPRVGPDGLILWENPQMRPYRRKYTVRSVDREAGTIDVDFVLHDNSGPGSSFAMHAEVGQRIGVIGPGGGGLAEADWYLFAGDETALPAISRMLEHLPAGVRGRAFIEVADAAEIQPLEYDVSIELEWLCRNGAEAGTTELLADAVRGTFFPDEGSKIYVWAGCEFGAFRAIRSHLRGERGLTTRDHLVVSYWRRGNREGSKSLRDGLATR